MRSQRWKADVLVCCSMASIAKHWPVNENLIIRLSNISLLTFDEQAFELFLLILFLLWRFDLATFFGG